MWNWIQRPLKNFKKKSPRQKAFDLLFLGLIVMMVVPGGRMFMQRILLHTGIYNASVGGEARELVPASDFAEVQFIDHEGTPHDLSEFKGKVIFLNYWATWCPPCKAEIPSLSNLYGKMREEEDLVFLFMTFEKIPVVQEFAANWELNFPAHFMTQNPPASLKAEGLPTTLIIDKKGQIVTRHTGMANWDTDEVYQQLKSLITESID